MDGSLEQKVVASCPLQHSSAHQRTISWGREVTGGRHWALLLSSFLLKPALSPQAAADPMWCWISVCVGGLDSSCILFQGNFDRQVGEGVEMWVVALPTVPCSRIRGQGIIEDLIEFQLPYPRTGVGACWEWTLADPWPRTTIDLLLMLVGRMNVGKSIKLNVSLLAHN